MVVSFHKTRTAVYKDFQEIGSTKLLLGIENNHIFLFEVKGRTEIIINQSPKAYVEQFILHITQAKLYYK